MWQKGQESCWRWPPCVFTRKSCRSKSQDCFHLLSEIWGKISPHLWGGIESLEMETEKKIWKLISPKCCKELWPLESPMETPDPEWCCSCISSPPAFFVYFGADAPLESHWLGEGSPQWYFSRWTCQNPREVRELLCAVSWVTSEWWIKMSLSLPLLLPVNLYFK